MSMSVKKRNDKWRANNPDYHLKAYQSSKDEIKVRRFNKIHGVQIPEDILPYARRRQAGECADCRKAITGREYIFLDPQKSLGIVLVCVACRRARNSGVPTSAPGDDDEY